MGDVEVVIRNCYNKYTDVSYLLFECSFIHFSSWGNWTLLRMVSETRMLVVLCISPFHLWGKLDPLWAVSKLNENFNELHSVIHISTYHVPIRGEKVLFFFVGEFLLDNFFDANVAEFNFTISSPKLSHDIKIRKLKKRKIMQNRPIN